MISCSTWGLPHVERVAAAREIHVVTRVGCQPVIARVIDAPEREGWPELVSLGGVVVDDVENDLDARGVQRADHRLEFPQRSFRAGVGCITRVGGEEAQGIVAPVVDPALLRQEAVIHVVMGREQFHGSHPEVEQMLDRSLRGQTRVGPAELLGHVFHPLGETLDMKLVDECFLPGSQRRTVVAPGESGVDDGRQRSKPGAVSFIQRQVGLRVIELIREQRVIPLQITADHLGIRIQQELLGVEPVPLLRLERTMHPVPVKLARNDVGKVIVPHLRCLFAKRENRRLPSRRPGH